MNFVISQLRLTIFCDFSFAYKMCVFFLGLFLIGLVWNLDRIFDNNWT